MKEYYYVTKRNLGPYVIDIVIDKDKIRDKRNLYENYEDAIRARSNKISTAMRVLRDVTPEPANGSLENLLKEFEKL